MKVLPAATYYFAQICAKASQIDDGVLCVHRGDAAKYSVQICNPIFLRRFVPRQAMRRLAVLCVRQSGCYDVFSVKDTI